jgi:hypothetical protein
MRARGEDDLSQYGLTPAHHPVLVVHGEQTDPKIREMERVGKGYRRDRKMDGRQFVVDDVMCLRRVEKDDNGQS